MSNQKHTPGPWRISSDAQGPCMVMHPSLPGVAIANCDAAHVPTNGYHSPAVSEPEPCPDAYLGTTYRPERVANVRLIAAAPELLEALKAIVDCYGMGETPEKFAEHVRGFIEDARAAISKATQG